MLVLDTNLLHGRADPAAARHVKTILSLAGQVGMKVAIPEGCLIELREAMREKLEEAQKGLSDSIGKLQQLRVLLEPVPLIDGAAALSQYEARMQDFLREQAISVLPFPREVPDVRTLFELAARKQPPFDPAGNSYRDAIIALTVEDRVRQENLGFVLFVTNDVRFQQVFTSDKVWCFNVEKSVKLLEDRLSSVQQRRREKIRDGVAQALTAMLADLAKRASAEVSFHVSPLEPGAKLLSIDRLTVTAVDSVEPADTGEDSVDFTAKARGELFYTVEVPPFSREARLRAIMAIANALRRPTKVGQVATESGEPSAGRPFSHSDSPSIESAKMPVILEVDGTASLDGDQVTGMQVVRLSSKPDSGLESLFE